MMLCSNMTTLLFLGLLTFPDHMLLGMGIMLSSSEVPRIAQQFGLDTSAKFNLSSVVHMTSTAVNLARHIGKEQVSLAFLGEIRYNI